MALDRRVERNQSLPISVPNVRNNKRKPAAKPRRTRTADELQAAAVHVSYEIRMLVYSAGHLGAWHSSPMETPSGNEKNMALESFLLHFRNLAAFLCPSIQTCGPDDIIASDFFDGRVTQYGDARQLSPDPRRIHRMLAHLSYSRRNYIAAGEHHWGIAEMLCPMLDHLRGFYADLPAGMALWFPPPSVLDEARSKAMLFLRAE